MKGLCQLYRYDTTQSSKSSSSCAIKEQKKKCGTPIFFYSSASHHGWPGVFLRRLDFSADVPSEVVFRLFCVPQAELRFRFVEFVSSPVSSMFIV